MYHSLDRERMMFSLFRFCCWMIWFDNNIIHIQTFYFIFSTLVRDWGIERERRKGNIFLPILSTADYLKWKESDVGIINKSLERLKDDKFIFIELTQFQDVKWKWLVTKSEPLQIPLFHILKNKHPPHTISTIFWLKWMEHKAKLLDFYILLQRHSGRLSTESSNQFVRD